MSISKTRIYRNFGRVLAAVAVAAAAAAAQDAVQLPPEQLQAEQIAAESDPAVSVKEDRYVQKADTATGEISYIKLEGDALPGQAVFVVREMSPGSGQYFYVQLEEQPAAPQSLADSPLVEEPDAPGQPCPPYYHARVLRYYTELDSASGQLTCAPHGGEVPGYVIPPPPAPIAPTAAEPEREQKMPKNYITFSPFFPAISFGLGYFLGTDGFKTGLNENLEMKIEDVYLMSEMVLNTNGKAEITNIKSSGGGFDLQYERQLHKKFALMGRFQYVSIGMSMDFSDKYPEYDLSRPSYSWNSKGEVIVSYPCVKFDENGDCFTTDKFNMDVDYSNWSFELHNRFYPRTGKSLFLDGVVGFGSVKFGVKRNYKDEGEYVVKTPTGYKTQLLTKEIEVLNVPAKLNYMIVGPMFGWREAFGKGRGRFIWETSFGYLAGIGFGDPITDQITDGSIVVPDLLGDQKQDIEDAVRGTIGLVENLMMVGGPRFRMTIGWGF